MGISGITDGERKTWESKRAWCIREVSALLEKFRLWKEEERRRKVEKELSVRDEASVSVSLEPEGGGSKAEDESSHISTPTDVDRLAALQLHTETLSASTPTASTSSKSKSRSKASPKSSAQSRNVSTSIPTSSHQDHLQSNSRTRTSRTADHILPSYTPLSPEASPPDQPITSFFSKPHMRAAAMDQKHSHRRSGRSRYAFGEPLPELEDAEFRLPGGMVTDEAINTSARDRRQKRRSIKESSKLSEHL